jgi:uncharacterized RDD family membrane protein YckC
MTQQTPPACAPAPDQDGDPRPYADLGARLGGWLIDVVVVTVVVLVLTAPLHVVHQVPVTVRGMHTYRYRVDPLGLLIDAVIVILYGGILGGLPRGQTFGMMAVGTRVVRPRSDRPVGISRACGRAACEYLMFVALVLPWVIDMLYPLWDRQRQTLHDKIADTIVVAV